MIKGHGNDIHAHGHKIKIDFSSNVVPGGMKKRLKKHLAAGVKTLNNYPEPGAGKLRETIARHHGLEKRNILVTNGSTGAFHLIARSFRGKKSCILFPSFAEYGDACHMYGHEIAFLHYRSFTGEHAIETDLLWVCSPNNPDGAKIPTSTILRFCNENPGTIGVLDEAYAELCRGFSSCIQHVKETPNIIVARSMTKAHGIPGLRLGYLAAGHELLAKLHSCLIPWEVNALAIKAGLFIMQYPEALKQPIKQILDNSMAFQEDLQKINGLEVIPSACNFFLVQLSKGKARDLKQYLLEKHGILIREASNFRGLDGSYLRLATRGKKQNNKLKKAIQQWLSRQS